MSLESMLRSTCTLQRPTTTKDEAGGRSLTFASVSGQSGVGCDVQPAGSSVIFRFMQQAIVCSHTIFVARDIAARAGDRVAVGDRLFLVIPGGYEPPAANYIQWPCQVHVQEIPHTP